MYNIIGCDTGSKKGVCTVVCTTNECGMLYTLTYLSLPPPSWQTQLSGVQRNLFSSTGSPLLTPEGLNGLRPSSPFVPPFAFGPPIFSPQQQRDRPPTPIRDPPPRVSGPTQHIQTLCTNLGGQLRILSHCLSTHTHTHTCVCLHACLDVKNAGSASTSHWQRELVPH